MNIIELIEKLNTLSSDGASEELLLSYLLGGSTFEIILPSIESENIFSIYVTKMTFPITKILVRIYATELGWWIGDIKINDTMFYRNDNDTWTLN